MKKLIQGSIILFAAVIATSLWATEFSADMIAQMVTGKMSGKIYFKNPDVTRNDMMGMISITKRPVVYQIFTGTKKYHVSNIDEIKDENPMAAAGDFNSWIKENKMKKIGQESLSGYKCQIYEGMLQTQQSHPPTHIKLWYSKKLNYPIKTEITLPPPMGTMTSYLENIEVGKLDKSLFVVPDGYTEVASMAEAMGMPDFGALMNNSLGGGGEASGGNAVPSKEEMEEMMNKMQEMMKQMKN